MTDRTRGDDLFEALAGLGGTPGVPGTVYLVGGGPGDPGLLSVRGAMLLATCDVVLHDRLSPPAALALVPEDAERILVGKRYGEAGTSRADVDALMADRAVRGKVVVRLKGGDPYVFGRGGEEATALDLAGVPFEVVHGVTSAVAVPGAGGIPVTHRGLAAGFAVITGHEDPSKPGGHVDYTTLGRFPGTLLFLMGVGHLPDITANLMAHGKAPDTPAAIIRWGTTPRQRALVSTLESLADDVAAAGIRSPAITVVGDVATLGSADGAGLNWRARRPLQGVSVLVPRTRAQASSLSARIRTLGGDPVEAPTIAIEPGDEAALGQGLRRMAFGAYRGICLTSPNGVEAVATALDHEGLDARAFAMAGTVACVGPGTAAALWRRLRVRADLVPDTFTTEGLGRAFPAASDEAATVLLPRADIATNMLADALEEKGWSVDEIAAYRTVRPDAFSDDVLARLRDGGIDLIAFASSSTARNFHAMVDGHEWSGRIVSIGPVTSATCVELGLEVAVEADPHDLDGLTDALVRAAAQPS